MPVSTEETDYKKLFYILQMISMLQKPAGFKLKHFAQRFQLSERTIYRYVEILEAVGFVIERDTSHRYRIIAHRKNEKWTSELSFTLEEAELIQEAVAALHSSHPLKSSILEKLYTFSEMDDIAELIADSHVGHQIMLLNKAIREEKQVVLENYYSVNSDQQSNRLVEPVAFIRNMRYLQAFEVDSGGVKQYKPERIGEVRVLETPFQYKHQHRKTSPDHFGMNSEMEDYISLKLNSRACSLLKEEFPLAEEDIKKDYSGKYIYSSLVKGYEGVGRFVMGLPGEIQVLESEGLKEYVRGKLARII